MNREKRPEMMSKEEVDYVSKGIEERVALEEEENKRYHSSSSDDEEADLEPDSLAESNSDTETLHISDDENEENSEIEKVFKRGISETPVQGLDKDHVIAAAAAEKSQSRASNVSYFVDFIPKSSCGNGTTNQLTSNVNKADDARMTQSMFVRSESRESQASISFFVDIAGGEGCNNKNTPVHDLHSKRPPRVNKASKAFFKKVQEYLEFISEPCLSKDEARGKISMGRKLASLMEEEETKLKKGGGIQLLATEAEVDMRLLKEPEEEQQPETESGKARPVSAYNQRDSKTVNGGSSNKKKNGENSKSSGDCERPVLRRERTFDLEPGKGICDIVNIDSSEEISSSSSSTKKPKRLSVLEEQLLKDFQKEKSNMQEKLDSELNNLVISFTSSLFDFYTLIDYFSRKRLSNKDRQSPTRPRLRVDGLRQLQKDSNNSNRRETKRKEILSRQKLLQW